MHVLNRCVWWPIEFPCMVVYTCFTFYHFEAEEMRSNTYDYTEDNVYQIIWVFFLYLYNIYFLFIFYVTCKHNIQKY